MNRIDFTKTGGILRSQELWNFLQQSYTTLFMGLANLIGNNVIVAGVADLGANYGDGWVSIGGELLPFVGGLKASRIIVVETITQKPYGDGVSKDAFYTRVAQCASSGGTAFTSFTRLSDLTQLATTSYVDTRFTNLINAAPSALDTLKELADALGDDANFASTMTTALAGKVAKAGDTMTGNLTIPDGTAANHAVSKQQLDTKAAKSGDTFTGAMIFSAAAEFDGGIKYEDGTLLHRRILPIGDWNMDSTQSKVVDLAPYTTWDKVVSVHAFIRADAGINTGVLNIMGHVSTLINTYLQGSAVPFNDGILATNQIYLTRLAGGIFDSSDYDSTGYNRGYIIIEFLP
jgi:hypothetical protein